MMEEEKGHFAKPHPWHRLFARILDYVLFSCVLSLIRVVMGLQMDVINPIVFALIVFFLWIFAEATLLASWGKTPGKSLFNIVVTDDHHQKLSFSKALKRSILVWWFGIAMGLPILSIITPIIAYVRLNHRGITYWDQKGNFRAVHEPIGPFRKIVIVIFVILFLSILALNFAGIVMQYHSMVKS